MSEKELDVKALKKRIELEIDKYVDAKKLYKQARLGVDYFEDGEGLRHDIKERDPKFKKIINVAEAETRKILDTKFNFRNDVILFRQTLWSEKKRILKEKHNIDWKTLIEMNPDTMTVTLSFEL